MRLLSLAFLCLSALPGQTGLPAFPGAEGFGARAWGGRGGAAVIVSNLNDSGPGSFREACERKGPRLVVFQVGGLIDLKSPIHVTEPFITIAGQTAPGDGICLRGFGLTVDTHDVVIRHLRTRPGDIAGREVDGMSIGGNSRNVIVDHCSASWSVDELLSASGAISNVTVQWCIIAESLNKSVHSKGAHGYGSLVRAIGGLTLHHNLWAHNAARNPRLGDNYGKPPFPVFDVRNNVIYDYGAICSGMTGEVLSANYAGNYIRPGPSSDRKRGAIVLTDTASVQYFVAGNVVEGNTETTADNRRLFDKTEAKGRQLVQIAERPFAAPSVMVSTAEAAFEAVLSDAGATRPTRDVVDTRIVEQVRKRTGRIIDSQKDVGGWQRYRTVTGPVDTDRDGIPDAWETAHKLNPRSAADALHDADGDGYTNLEEYINELAAR